MAKPQGVRERIESGAEKSPAPSAPVYFTTGCTLQDIVLGGGLGMGYRAGTLVNVVAINQGGKSQGAAECIAHNYHKSKKEGADAFWWDYIIRERRWSFDTMSTYGVEVASLDNPYPKTIEAWDGWIGNKMDQAKSPGIIVTDSLDAFSTDETEERAETRQKQVAKGDDVELKGSFTIKTGTPALLSETLRIRMDQAQRSNTLLLVLSQIRTKLDATQWDPDKLIRNGGKALDHWCNEVVWLKPLRKLYVGKESDGSERCVGVVVRMWTTKSSTPRPYRECIYTVLFDYGIDNIGSNIDYLFNLRNPKSGAFWGSEERKSDRRDDVCPLTIEWSVGKPKNLETVKAWLVSVEKLDACVADCKAEKKMISMSYLESWIARDSEALDAFRKEFPCYTRDQLIKAVEESEEMALELERRVLEKWERIEQEAASHRKRKF